MSTSHSHPTSTSFSTSSDLPTREQLKQLDKDDPLNWTRNEFEIPNAKACGGEVEGEAVYFCGNSLGLLAKKARQYIIEELDVWGSSGVTGHFDHSKSRPWKHVDRPLIPHLARLLGAQEDEIAHTSTLTSNMHNLFTSFYRPSEERWKIVIEKGAFPSDWYAVHSHPQLHDNVLSQDQIDNAVIALEPREGEDILRTEDILKVLDDNKDEVAIVWLPLVQYYTAQLFEIPPISHKTHEIGALLGLDLAHGTGNVECKLDEWEVDFAVWCTYKYLNAGPASIGGLFVRNNLDFNGRRLHGWWGNDAATRFEMAPIFRPSPGAKAWQHSCTPVLSSIPLLATLELIDKVGFPEMLKKSKRLTGLLERYLKQSEYYIPNQFDESSPNDNMSTARDRRSIGFKIITPPAPNRGTQLSLSFTPEHIMPSVFTRMLKRGLVGDERKPSVIRLSPVVLYNTFEEVGKAVEILEEAMREEEAEGDRRDDEKGRDVIGGDSA